MPFEQRLRGAEFVEHVVILHGETTLSGRGQRGASLGANHPLVQDYLLTLKIPLEALETAGKRAYSRLAAWWPRAMAGSTQRPDAGQDTGLKIRGSEDRLCAISVI